MKSYSTQGLFYVMLFILPFTFEMKKGLLKKFIDDNKCMQVNANQKWRVGG